MIFSLVYEKDLSVTPLVETVSIKYNSILGAVSTWNPKNKSGLDKLWLISINIFWISYEEIGAGIAGTASFWYSNSYK